jgi:peptidoglycan/xylan/chitin deacetylase (PgdA/CDA1 family)
VKPVALWHRLTEDFPAELARAARRFDEFHFDDGYADIGTAADALELRDLRGVFFVVTGWIGLRGQASAALVRELHGRGHTIGNHTYSHPLMDRIPPAAMVWELTRAQNDLADLLGVRPRRLAWPYGRHDGRTDKIARRYGLEGRGIERGEVFVADRWEPGPGMGRR